MKEEYKSTAYSTMEHIRAVHYYLGIVLMKLIKRSAKHDETKLREPEVGVFAKYIPKLAGCTYGSDEYKQYLKEMKEGLDYHYKYNKHHPEYFQGWPCSKSSSVDCMSLIDLIEMLCDWKAATLRHDDGDIYKSIEINKKRFGLSDQLVSILKNTVDEMQVR